MNTNTNTKIFAVMVLAVIENVIMALFMLWAWKVFLADTFPDIQADAGTFFGALVLIFLVKPVKKMENPEITKDKLISAISQAAGKAVTAAILIVGGGLFM